VRMPRPLTSLRRRSRKWIVAAFLVGGAVVAGSLLIGNTADPQLPVTNRPSIVDHPRKSFALTPADKKVIVAEALLFVRTAVRRNHPERAWSISSPSLRSGTTLAEWKEGTLPFAPYPVRSARWNIAYSVVGEVGLDVLVQSTDPDVRPLVHRLTLVPNRRSQRPAWLVDGWVPMTMLPGGYVAPQKNVNPFATATMPRTTPSPGAFWILTPFVILVAAFAFPVAIMLRSRRAARRIRRRHAQPGPGAN
jgi:hypothetical protein